MLNNGQGFKCIIPECDRIIPYSKSNSHSLTTKNLSVIFRWMISKEKKKQLDERIREESLAIIPNLERCKRCNYAVIIEASKENMLFFPCQKCHAFFCRYEFSYCRFINEIFRVCKRDAYPAHFEISCDELDMKEADDYILGKAARAK